MNTLKTMLAGSTLLALSFSTGEAALQSRLGGQAVYDTDLATTWLANANLAATNTFGVGGISVAGRMDWGTAGTWLAAMNTALYLGVGDWRLPQTVAPDATCSLGDITATGYNCTGSEMGHLFYVELSGTAGSPIGGSGDRDLALFQNIGTGYYWSSDYTPSVPTTDAWEFSFFAGHQVGVAKTIDNYVWPVRSGDIDADNDGIPTATDNCTLVANATQLDSDGDGYGNICDPDFNNDGAVNINDYNRLKARLGITPVTDLVTDLDGNGAVNINDLNRLKSYLGQPPGPSGLHPNCPPTCP